MGELLDAVVSYLEEGNYEFRPLTGLSALEVDFAGRHAFYDCRAITDEDAGLFLFLGRCPLVAPEARRPAVLDLLNRINEGLRIGNFEMDPQAGTIRFRTGFDVEGVGLAAPLVRNAIGATVSALDHFLPAVALVIHAGVSPAQALEVPEGPREDMN